jgi:tetratricopeptide (TPR) repeat protein
MTLMPTRRRNTQAALFLAAFTAILFGRVATYPFVAFDDNFYVTENPFVRAGLSFAGLRWAFFTDSGNYWHPLAIVSHMLDVQLFGLNPAGHHLVSLLLHVAAVVVLFFTLKRLTGDFWPSLFTAAVFAIHPVQVESVAWIAERKTILAGLAMLAALWAYARHVERPSKGRLAAVAATFAVSLMSKPSAVAFPLLLVLVDYWPLRRKLSWTASLREKLPLAALAAASCVATRLSSRYVTGVPLGDRLLNTPVFYLRYLGEALWPSGLSVFHPYPLAPRPWLGLGAALILAGITAAVIRLRRKNPALAVGWLWFAASIAPMAGLVAVGAHSIADRFLYIPLIGLAIMAAWGLPAAFPRPKACGTAGAAALGALIFVTAAQLSFWKDSVALFERAAAVEPDSALVQTHLGFAYFERGDLPAAIARYRRALELAPADFAARNYLGIALASEGDLRAAIEELTRAEAVAPDPAAVAGNLKTLRAALAAGARPAVRGPK